MICEVARTGSEKAGSRTLSQGHWLTGRSRFVRGADIGMMVSTGGRDTPLTAPG